MATAATPATAPSLATTCTAPSAPVTAPDTAMPAAPTNQPAPAQLPLYPYSEIPNQYAPPELCRPQQ
ncbi:hypothetical protein C0992_008880, partial [Termitomyces sp. T32_za158]